MNKPWKRLLLAFGLSSAAQFSAWASTTLINFDSIASHSDPNLAAPAGISFHNAWFVADQDEYGSDIPGTEKWQMDPNNANNLFAENPSVFSYGAAPSGLNALDATQQAVMVQFGTPLDLSSFSVTLDNSTYGNLGDSPILFYSRNGNTDTLLASLSVDQTIPGLTATQTGLTSVDYILLPSGAFYDNIQLTIVPVPEPNSLTLSIGALGLLAFSGRRVRR